MAIGSIDNETTPAKLLAKSGLLANLSGIGANASMIDSIGSLKNNSIPGIMNRVFVYAAGALGNRLNAAYISDKGALAGLDPLQSINPSTLTALSKLGNQLIPGLSNVLPASIATTTINQLNGILGTVNYGAPTDASSQFAMAGGLSGTLEFCVNNMTGGEWNPLGIISAGPLDGTLPNLIPNTKKDLLRYTNIINSAVAFTESNKSLVSAISEGMSINFGSGPSGYGAKVRNMQDAMTFSVTTLGQNINAIASDLINMGDWEATDLMRFMQPGHIALQILQRGLGDITGLIEELTELGIPIAGIDNPQYDSLTLKALNNINNGIAINYVKTAFSMNVEFSKLGDICLLDKMMLASKDNLPVQNFRELGVQLSYIGINNSTTVRTLGEILSKIETSTDLNHISQLENPLPDDIGTHLMQIFGYGGGAFGEQTIVDIIGTAAGYIHNDSVKVIVDTANYISTQPDAINLLRLTTMLENTLKGKYTSLGKIGDINAIPAVPDEPGYITVPFTSGPEIFNTIDAAILAFIPLIEAEQQQLLSTSNSVLLDNILKLDIAYKASCSQLVRENNNLTIHNISLFNTYSQAADAISFVSKLDTWALDKGYGTPSEYIERVVTDDVYGNAILYIMRQTRNAELLKELGIDTDQHKLPKSQYYNNPTEFYTNLYSGSLSGKSKNQTNLVLPKTINEVYALNRYNLLANNGYDKVVLTDSQKTEAYYDLMWKSASSKKNEVIGRKVVFKAIADRIIIVSNDLYIIDAYGNNVKFGTIINKSSVLILSKEDFILNMLDAVNNALYGNISVSKTTNPFNTEQMIYGVLELLLEVSKDNILGLMETVTGKLLALSLLKKLLVKFDIKRNQFDTGMDRNDPAAWGDTGPAAIPL